jgi:hypothetical protein
MNIHLGDTGLYSEISGDLNKSAQLAGCQRLMPVILARRQRSRGSRFEASPRQNSSTRPYLRKTLHKNRAGGVAQGEGLEFKPQYMGKKRVLSCYEGHWWQTQETSWRTSSSKFKRRLMEWLKWYSN